MRSLVSGWRPATGQPTDTGSARFHGRYSNPRVSCSQENFVGQVMVSSHDESPPPGSMMGVFRHSVALASSALCATWGESRSTAW